MNKSLLDRIHNIDRTAPYFWRLRLTPAQYGELREYVSTHTDDALAVMAYLAEWYKREYAGSDSETRPKAVALDSADLQRIWEQSGLNTDIWVYRTEGGNRLWLYSIYVLGGLAIRHELARNDHGRFLKMLCRIYHGEDDTLHGVETSERAIAFRESIAQKHSLHAYLREILVGRFEDGDPQVSALITAIREANSEELKTKFRLEWIVTNTPGSNCLRRRLRLWLRPEEVGKTERQRLYQYIRHDRMAVWGIPVTEKNRDIRFDVRFFDGVAMVQEIRQALLFNYAGEYGYLANGADRSVTLRDITPRRFDRIDVVATDNDGNEYLVQREVQPPYMQLWRMEEYGFEWSNRTQSQKATAAIYTDPVRCNREADITMPFGQDGEPWHWNYILTDIRITTPGGRHVTLYNRTGVDQIYTRLYSDTIRYYEGGKVRFVEDDDEEGEVETLLPLLFSPADVMVRHFAGRQADEPETSDKQADAVEYKAANGRYLPWTEDNAPAFGPVTIRVTEKGVEHREQVLYLPMLNANTPILRDLDKNHIHYRGLDGEERVYEDSIARDYQPLKSTVTIRFEIAGEQRVEVDLFRPVELIEVYLDGKLYAYAGKELTLPYVLKQRVDLRLFGADGYRAFDCRSLPSLYPLLADRRDENIAAWNDGCTWQATQLIEDAPLRLLLCIGEPYAENDEGAQFYYWDMNSSDAPVSVSYDFNGMRLADCILFHGMKQPGKSLKCYAPKLKKHDPFTKGKAMATELECYLTAAEHKIYFFAMEPLRRMAQAGKTKEKLVRPLLELRGGTLTRQDVLDLTRLADEFRTNIEEIL